MQLYEMIEGISKFINFITFQLANHFCWATKLVKKTCFKDTVSGVIND